MIATCYRLRDVPVSSQGELRRLLQSISRRNLFRTRAKLLCKVHGLQDVVDVFGAGNYQARLRCGCRREVTGGITQTISRLEKEVWETAA